MNTLWITHIFVEILPGGDVRTAISQAINLAQEADCEVIIMGQDEKIIITSTTLVNEVMEKYFS